MQLHQLLDPDALTKLVAMHYINARVSPNGRHVLYDYTDRATYDRCWTAETRACRGLVVEQASGTIVARPFDKFPNLGEPGFPECAPDALAALPGPVSCTAKLDGSMVAVWYDTGLAQWRTSTRGSFVSAQALAALAWLRTNAPLAAWPTDVTVIGEWCAPDNRIVLRYDTAALRLLSVRQLDNGREVNAAALPGWGQRLGLPVVPHLPEIGLDDLCALAETAAGIEGWVLRWPDGRRVKLKTREYLTLHRLITGFSPARVREALLAGDAAAADYLRELPEEIRPDGEALAAALRGTVATRLRALAATLARLEPLRAESRRAFALAVQQEPVADHTYLFALADGKPVAAKLLASLDLDGLV